MKTQREINRETVEYDEIQEDWDDGREDYCPTRPLYTYGLSCPPFLSKRQKKSKSRQTGEERRNQMYPNYEPPKFYKKDDLNAIRAYLNQKIMAETEDELEKAETLRPEFDSELTDEEMMKKLREAIPKDLDDLSLEVIGKCSHSGCNKDARYLAANSPYAEVFCYCERHANEIASSGQEITVKCPNCGCLVGVQTQWQRKEKSNVPKLRTTKP